MAVFMQLALDCNKINPYDINVPKVKETFKFEFNETLLRSQNSTY